MLLTFLRLGEGRTPKTLVAVVNDVSVLSADVKTLTDAELRPKADEAREVTALGGLYVIGTERHESRRIDNQLRGRSGRHARTPFTNTRDHQIRRRPVDP